MLWVESARSLARVWRPVRPSVHDDCGSVMTEAPKMGSQMRTLIRDDDLVQFVKCDRRQLDAARRSFRMRWSDIRHASAQIVSVGIHSGAGPFYR